MFHLHKLLLTIRRPFSPVHYSRHRALLSTATVAASPVRFVAEDYLVSTCGLTKEQAAKAAKHVAHCKSACKANAVLSFLTSSALALSKADIAHLVSNDARILNCSVKKTLRPRIYGLFTHGFTAAQIRTFLRLAPHVFRGFNIDEKLGFWLPFLGSPEKFLHLFRRNCYIVTSNLERVVKVNVAFLRQCGLNAGDFAKLLVTVPRLVTMHPEYVQDAVRRATQLGVAPGSRMFRHALSTVWCIGQEKVDAKLAVLRETLGWSEEELNLAVSKAPRILIASEERLRRNAEFLLNEVGLPPDYIARLSVLLMYSLERRLVPRHVVVKVLKEKGLVDRDRCFFTVVAPTEEKFLEKFVAPYEEFIPGLADAYESACSGNVLGGI